MVFPLLSNDFFIPVVSERLIIKSFSESDADRLAALAGDVRVSQNLARARHPYSLIDAQKYIERCHTDLKTKTELGLGVYLRSDGQLIGSIGITNTGEIGYWLGYDYWGKGFGKEAAKALVEFAFLTLKMPQLKATARLSNTASRQILTSLGFKETDKGISTSLAVQGQFPSIIYTLLREDFMKTKVSLPILLVVAVVLKDEQGRILLAERPSKKNMSGLWEFPGGKIEANESPEKALQRELQEELNILVKEKDLSPITFLSYPYEKFHLGLLLYGCDLWEGNLVGNEGQHIAWVKKNELKNHLTLPANISIFSSFINL